MFLIQSKNVVENNKSWIFALDSVTTCSHLQKNIYSFVFFPFKHSFFVVVQSWSLFNVRTKVIFVWQETESKMYEHKLRNNKCVARKEATQKCYMYEEDITQDILNTRINSFLSEEKCSKHGRQKKGKKENMWVYIKSISIPLWI